MMRTEREDGKLRIRLEGRIDSENAERTLAEIRQALAENPGCEPVFDAGELTYLSSAGLRALLSIARNLGRKPAVVNVAPDVYEILEMTGFTELLDVKKKAREIRLDGCPVIARGAFGTVYRLDPDTIVKVYDPAYPTDLIRQEQNHARQAFLRGIPTAISYDIVKVGESSGVVFEMIKAANFNDLIRENPDRTEELIRRYAELILQIHAVEMAPGVLPEAKANYLKYLNELRDILPEDVHARVRELIEKMPEDLHVVHGDLHVRNVMESADGPMLIDMDTLSTGDPVFDLAGLYVSYVLFDERDPQDSVDFFGCSAEVSRAIWEKTAAVYFDGVPEENRREAEKRIRLAANLRFLYFIAVMKIGRPELEQIRTEDAVPRIRELAGQTDALAIRDLIVKSE